jgi:hypothetical protein
VDREKLIALRAAIDVVLGWPDSVRDEVARWFAEKTNAPTAEPPAVKPNGLAAAPPSPPARSPQRRAGKPNKAAAVDLVAALRAGPGLSARALAAKLRIARATVGDRLHRLAGEGVVEQDAAGRWFARETIEAAPVAVAAVAAAPAPSAKWVKPIGQYGRHETNALESSRFG